MDRKERCGSRANLPEPGWKQAAARPDVIGGPWSGGRKKAQVRLERKMETRASVPAVCARSWYLFLRRQAGEDAHSHRLFGKVGVLRDIIGPLRIRPRVNFGRSSGWPSGRGKKQRHEPDGVVHGIDSSGKLRGRGRLSCDGTSNRETQDPGRRISITCRSSAVRCRSRESCRCGPSL
jgi:hypothetical protein